MATTIGRVEYVVGLDGTKVPVESRLMGRKIGRELGKSSSDAFEKEFQTSQTSMWKRLSANTRQWTLIISAIAAGGSDIAALSSAAGAGLVVLGAGLTSAVIGGGAAVAVFAGLTGEISDMDEAIQPAAKSFQALGPIFKNLQKSIQVAALKNAAGAFDSIGDTAKQLEGPLDSVGESIGRIIDSFANGIKPGTKNFATLSGLIKVAGPNFEKMASFVGKFAEGFGTLFLKAQPLLDSFLTDLNKLGDSFITAADNSDAWLARSSTTLGKLGGLIGAATKAITDLVTPEAQDRLDAFIDHLTDFMPNLSNLLDIFGRLDVFGLLAQALDDLGKAFEPLAGPFAELADGLNRIAGIAIDQIAKNIGDFATALAPFVKNLADFTNDVDPQVIKNIADALTILGAVAIANGIVNLSGAIAGLVKKNAALIALATALDGLNRVAGDFNKDNKLSTSMDNLLGGVEVGGGIAGAIAAITTGVGLAAGALFVAIGALAGGVIAYLIDFISDPQKWIGWEKNLAQIFSDGLSNLITPEEIAAWGQGFIDSITGFFAQAGAGFSSSVTGFFSQIAQPFIDGFTGIMDGFISWRDGLIAGWDGMWSDIQEGFTTWRDGLFLGFLQWFSDVYNGFLTWWGQVVAGWNNFFAGAIAVVVSGLASIGSFFTNFGATAAAAWNGFWSGLGGIVSSIWTGIVSSVSSGVNSVIRLINGMISAVNGALSSIKDLTGGLVNIKIPSIPGLPKTAIGGVFSGAQARIIAEAGQEAVVPLDRPLSQVAPSVRGLSAIAQGKADIPTAGGAGVYVAPGAIVVKSNASDVTLVASAVLDRFVGVVAI